MVLHRHACDERAAPPSPHRRRPAASERTERRRRRGTQSPLRPFETADGLVDRSRHGPSTAWTPQLSEGFFDSLPDGDCLDLATRKGKAPGGCQYNRDFFQQAGCIFMDAAGLHRDPPRTMVHEAPATPSSPASPRHDPPALRCRHLPDRVRRGQRRWAWSS